MNIIPFSFKKLPVRVISDEKGDPWFVAMDVADVLGYTDAQAMTRRLDDDEKSNRQIVGLGTQTGGRGTTLVNEPGLYSCIIASKKPEAKPFKRWVTHEVLPAIRKTGTYSAPKFDIPKTLPDALRLAAEAIEERDKLKPKAEALDRIATSDGSLCVTNAAKDLQIRPKDLFAWLSMNRWIYRRPGGAGWIAYQEKLQAAYLEHKVVVVARSDGSEKTTEQVRITAKGLAKIATLLPKSLGQNGGKEG